LRGHLPRQSRRAGNVRPYSDRRQTKACGRLGRSPAANSACSNKLDQPRTLITAGSTKGQAQAGSIPRTLRRPRSSRFSSPAGSANAIRLQRHTTRSTASAVGSTRRMAVVASRERMQRRDSYSRTGWKARHRQGESNSTRLTCSSSRSRYVHLIGCGLCATSVEPTKRPKYF